MEKTNEHYYVERFNNSVYEMAQAEKNEMKGDLNEEKRLLRSSAESISQSLENALKVYLNRNLKEMEKQFLKQKPTIPDLVGKFIDEDGSPGDYYYQTKDEATNSSVDFVFLKESKGVLTNWSKHNGKDPDQNIIIKYIQQTRRFILEYLQPEARLKIRNDFFENNTANWDLLYSACDRFNPNERVFILVLGPNKSANDYSLKALSLPGWTLIVDFDYNSEKSGFFKSAYASQSPSPHKIKIADTVDNSAFSVYTQAHYHLFANNYAGGGIEETESFNEWNRKYAKKADLFFKSFAEVFSTQKTIVLSLYNSKRYVDAICALVDRHFNGNAQFIFANDLSGELDSVKEDWNGIKVNIPISEIADGIYRHSSNFGERSTNYNQYIIPHMESSGVETSGQLSPDEFAKYEEYFEVVHKGLPSNDEGELDRREFLVGSHKISWYGLEKSFDVQKKGFFKSFIRPLERVFENSRGKVNLIHDAGFGGTTVARRIAWHFHEDYPTLILKNYRENKVRELLITLHQKTRKTIFLILEVPQSITMDEVEALYRSIPQARPVVFLVVKRGKPKTDSDLAVNDWGNNVSDLINAYRPFIEEYDSDTIKAKKSEELESIIFSNDPIKKTPFYVGLLTFDENFFAIKDYIRKFCLELLNKSEQKKALLYLSLCEEYANKGLPASFFKRLFKVGNKDILNIENYFSPESGIIESLLTSLQEGVHKIWRIRHVFFARELKYQLLSGTSDNPEIWKEGLSELCYNLIWDSKSDGNVFEYTQEVLQQLFIGSRRDRAGTDFTWIIRDIENLDGKERVFRALKEAYPENPHYCSHLARFYAYHNKNRDLALKYADEAISLSLAEGNEDPLLYHIKGMCLRANISDLIDKHIWAKQNGRYVSEDEQNDIIYNLVPNCARQFELSREINKRSNRNDEHGFVANIQLLIMAIDYGIKMSGKNKADFFKSDPDPFGEWLDQAESLLEEVKRTNFDDDESGKIEECVNELLAFYENYEQILQNLRNQLQKSKSPTRVRRQIVRTYFKKKENYRNDPKVVSNILALMETNIENEPDNERNFYLWFQAARHSSISIDDAISKLSKWKAQSKTVDSIYYFYILKVIRALQGYSEATQDAINLLRECRQKGKSNITVYEWLGKGNSVDKLIRRDDLDSENKEDQLVLVDGYFTEYVHDGSGRITIADRLDVFFSPTQAKLTSNDINQPVQFYLGFSYDGLRADSYSVRIKDREPRNRELVPTTSSKAIGSQNKISDGSVLKETETTPIDDQSNGSMLHSKRHNGKVIDLRWPPKYIFGKIEDSFGKIFFFHKNNEAEEVFDKLAIKTPVSFEIKKSEKGFVAFNIRIEEQLED